MFARGRPLKRWRWVGVFGEELMLCAAQVRIGPARQSFWAMHSAGRAERCASGRGCCRDGARSSSSRGGWRSPTAACCSSSRSRKNRASRRAAPNGRSESWTRKQAGVRAHGTLALDGGAPRPLEALAVIDDSAGWHQRITEWRWSAGVGEAPDGTPLAWNLVTGINDPAHGSERAVWVDGEPHEVAPVEFDPALRRIRGGDGSELRFTAEAERSRRENLLLLSSDYRAPFGTFSGTLPGGVELAPGRGVMEHHRARW